MIRLCSVILALTFACSTTGIAADNDIAPTGTLRAVYIATNMAHAVQDPATGAIRGPSADVARELGRRLGVPVDVKPASHPEGVIGAVVRGEADIGFVAFALSRVGNIEFSQTYMLVQQTFVVLDRSAIRAVADVDRAGHKIAGVRTDSTTAYMKRNFKQATIIEVDNNNLSEVKRLLFDTEIDAFAANRQRHTAFAAATPGTRVLPDNLLRIPQTIVVAKGKTAALAKINQFINEARESGFLKAAIDRNDVVGVDVAPAGSLQPQAP
jgi:polar amino acid transport system substrate-binding protein